MTPEEERARCALLAYLCIALALGCGANGWFGVEADLVAMAFIAAYWAKA